MPHATRVLDYLRAVAPKGATNGEIRQHLGLASHQTVYMVTQQLLRQKLVTAERDDHAWVFRVVEEQGDAAAPPLGSPLGVSTETIKLSPYGFEALARQVLTTHYGTSLTPGSAPPVRKLFNFVSPDRQIIGDAKYYALVRGLALPPAKFSVIAEHVWLLEKTEAPTTFLVFGNDQRVPERWLERYGNLVCKVAFYFLSDDGSLVRLN